MSPKLKIVVLMGGPSPEHEVSLNTGNVILKHLDKSKYQITPVTISREGQWLSNPHADKKLSWSNDFLAPVSQGLALDHLQSPRKPDMVFIAMHGAFGEDGTIQGLLDFVGLRYTGSGVLASSLSMDKEKYSQFITSGGFKIPKFICFTYDEWRSDEYNLTNRISKFISFPLVVKPNNAGSSVGISIVKSSKVFDRALKTAGQYSIKIMVQEFIQGVEITCGVLDEGNGKNAFALPPTEIIPKSNTFFDYDSKYIQGGSEEITPARLPSATLKSIQETALNIHQILGCSGMSRTDMLIKKGKVYVLETNTIPGMTQTSLLPQAAQAAGITFSGLLDRIINAAK